MLGTLLLCFETRVHVSQVGLKLYVVKDGPERLILLSPPSKSWFYRPVPPYTVYAVLGIKPKPLCMLGRN